MNDKVVEFKPKSEPHLSGDAHCMCCQYKWVATAPTGTYCLDCPKCGTSKGRFMHEVVKSELDHWTCNCGSVYFSVTPRGFYCPNCGKDQEIY